MAHVIQILGTECPKCKSLLSNAELAVKELNIDCRIKKVSDIKEIVKFGVIITPALVVDGEVKSVGKVLSVEEIKQILQGNERR